MRIWKHTKDLGIGLLVSIALFGLCEAAMWALGIGDGAGDTDLSRGFDTQASYFKPDPAMPGRYHTQFFNGIKKEHVIPVKRDRRRVMLFGGSNTRGFQEGRLPEAFDALAKDEFQVVNLGRSGYGSGRVAIIFEQALELLEPDIVVLYLGHNEFVEAGFQLDLERAAWSSDLTREVGELMRSTRTVSLLSDVFGGMRAPVQDRPAAWNWEYAKFAHLRYDETLAYFAAYEARIDAMCKLARKRGVEVVLCTVIYNRFSSPFISNFPEGAAPEQIKSFRTAFDRAQEQTTDSIRGLIPKSENQRIHIADWKKGQAQDDKALWDRPLPGRRPCTGPLAEQDPMLGQARRFMRKIWTYYEHLEVFFEGRLSADERGALERAELDLKTALELFPQHAHALFVLALVEHALGRPAADVREHIEAAQRYDCAPRKASALVNDLIKGVAARNEGVLLLDADAVFASYMPMQLTGWEWMVDHCHLNIGARIALMEHLARVIVETYPAD